MKRLRYIGPLSEVYVPLLGQHTEFAAFVRKGEPFDVKSDALALRLLAGNGAFVYDDTGENPHLNDQAAPLLEELAVPARAANFTRSKTIRGRGRTIQAPQRLSASGTVTPYFDALKLVADRYFAQWPEQRQAILAGHQAEGERLVRDYRFADVAEMRAFMEKNRERTLGDVDKTLRENAQTNVEQDDFPGPSKVIHAWIEADAGRTGGVFGGYLTIGPGAIIPLNEIAKAYDASDDELRARPPVSIRWAQRDLSLSEQTIDAKLPVDGFYVAVPGNATGFMASDLPSDLRALLVAFANETNAVIQEPAHLAEMRREIRDAYHAFAKKFWSWHESGGFRLGLSRNGKDVTPTGSRPVFPIREGETFLIPSAQVFQGAHRAMVSREGWNDTGTDWPSFKDSSGVVYSIGGITGDGTFRPTTDEGLQADLAALEPEMSLAFAAAMGAWTQAFHNRTLSQSGAVVFHVNDILELRGLKRTKDGTFKPEQKRAVAARLHRLEKFYASGEAPGSDGRKMRLTGRLIDVVTAEAEDLFGMTPYGFAIRPGLAVAPFFEQSPQLAHFFTKLAALDTKQGVERIAYLLGLYLVFQFRVREKSQNFAQPFLVKTLLVGARVPIEANSKHFTRFRDNAEAALDRLKAVGCVAGWEYETGDTEALPDRGWFRPWLEKCRVKITPPEPILESAALRSEERQKAIAAAARQAPRKKKQA